MEVDMKEKIQIMSVHSNCSIRKTMNAINEGALGAALLIDPESERFVGMVTDGDIRRALLKGLGLESPVTEVQRPKTKTGHISMSPDQISVIFSEPVRIIPILNDEGKVVDLSVYDRRSRLPVAEPFFGENELRYVSECVLTGWVSSAGKFVNRFEKMFSDFCGARYAVSTCNGTAALHLALLALDIGPGDEVIVPTLSFIATANAVTYTGARPIFVDSEKETWNIDPDLIEESISPRTKAIIAVHLYGHPANMDQILEIANRYNLKVIEDAAEAHGARYNGHRVGCIGDIGAFSFYGNKIVTTGEGGMVVTNQADIAEKIRILRDHGMSRERRYWHSVLGYNYRLTNIQAALGIAQMERIEEILNAKRNIAQLYKEELTGIRGLEVSPESTWAESVYWMFSILIDEDKFGMSRDMLMRHLEQNDIETRPFFPPMHIQPIYDKGQKLPIAEWLSVRGINLPSSTTLQPQEIRRICNAIRTAQDKYSEAIG